MNKTFIAILIAVCLLGMALTMFSERLSRKPESGQSIRMEAANTPLPNLAADNGKPSGEITLPVVSEPIKTEPLTQLEKENRENAIKLETSLAESALNQRGEIREIPEISEQAKVPDIALNNPVVAPAPETAEIKIKDPAAEVQLPDKKPEEKPAPVPVAPTPAVTEKPAPVPQKAQPAVKPAPATPKTREITNFVIFARDKGATVRFTGNGKIKYKSMTLENPHRVVVDFEGDWKFPERLAVPKNEMVNAVRVGKNGENTRAVIDLKEKPRVSRIVEGQNGNNVDVRIDR